MNSLAELWHREDDLDGEVDLLILQQRDRYVASVHETGGDKASGREEPKTPFPYDECGWDYIDDTSTTTHLSRRQELRKFRSIVNLVSGRFLTDTGDEVVFGTRCVDISKGDENKPFLPQSTGRAIIQTSSRFVNFHSHSTTRGSAKFVDLRNN